MFISYRRDLSSDLARTIKEVLGQRKINAFLDVGSLDSGLFDESLLAMIERTPNFVVILCDGSLKRCRETGDWLRREVAHAIQSRRNVVPIIDPPFQMPHAKDLPAEMSALPRYQGVKHTQEYFEAFMNKLVLFLKEIGRE